MALNAGEVYRERYIHAEIGSHIVEGTAGRLFKDSKGVWQVINHKTDRIDWEEIGDLVGYHRPQIELYALPYPPALSRTAGHTSDNLLCRSRLSAFSGGNEGRINRY